MDHKTTRMAKVYVAPAGVSAASSTAIKHKQATARWNLEAKRMHTSYAQNRFEQDWPPYTPLPTVAIPTDVRVIQ
jgi:hypothetical protein